MRKINNYGQGRVDVFPFKIEDFNEMTRLCLINIDRNINHKKTYYRWYRNYMILILGVNTGCRIEVLLQLTPKHLNGGCCRIKEFKTGKISRYELSNEVYELVSEYIETFDIGDNEYLFRTSIYDHKPLTRQAVYIFIQDLAKKAGVKYSVGCHSLRKSFGRWTYDDTKDIHLVQRMLGHSNPIITQQYICLEEEHVARKRKQISYGLKNRL